MKTAAEMSVEEKKILNAYKRHAGEMASEGKSAIPFDQFKKNFADYEKQKEAEEARKEAEREKKNRLISVTQKGKDLLEAMGWSISDFTPANGPFEGQKGQYLVNSQAKVNGAGFLRTSEGKLVETRKRLIANVEAIDVFLANLA